MTRKRTVVDIVATNYQSIIMIESSSRKGLRWLRRHVPGEVIPIACKPRYGVDILRGALAAGLRLQDSTTGRIAVQPS